MNILAAALVSTGAGAADDRPADSAWPPAMSGFAIFVSLFTNRGDFDYGKISQQSGFAHDMLAAALCPEP